MATQQPTPEEMARRMRLAREALDSLPKDENGIPVLDLRPEWRKRLTARDETSRISEVRV